MFTGLVEEVGTLVDLKKTGSAQRLISMQCNQLQSELKVGDSVSVNGVCLTVTSFDIHRVTMEISGETIKCTLFGELPNGSLLNLERALKFGDRLGGHLVQGHVEGCIEVLGREKRGGFYEFIYSLPKWVRSYLVEKGSVSIDGISLTVAELLKDRFKVAIIPHTYENTNLKVSKLGQKVHIETDIFARYVERILAVRLGKRGGGGKYR